jgi:predicted dehydrogenase
MDKVKWGILSTAKIGTGKVIPGMQRGELCDIVAISSRDQARAQEAARALGIPRAYGSYEAMLADPEIQAVYNPLPNHLHVPWTIKALEAGKHVLCEKPIALSVAEAEELVAAAARFPHLKVMEAFMYRHHPQWQTARQMVLDGKIGRLQTVHAFFCYNNTNPRDIRNQADIGGGAMMDIGCYCVSWPRYIFGSEPQRVVGMIERDPGFDTDRLASGMLDFGSGTATFTTATQIPGYQRVNIYGSEGRIEIEIPGNAPPDRPCIIWYEHNGKIEEIALPTADQYTLQGDNFSRAILEDTPVLTPLSDAVANMRVIEGILQSAEKGEWVNL